MTHFEMRNPNEQIAKYYSKIVLEKTEPRKIMPSSFQQINNELNSESGIKIPDSLIEKLGLKEQIWMRFSRKSDLPILILGQALGSDNDRHYAHNNSLRDAVSTIEIARKTTDNGRKMLPIYLRIAGIYEKKHRVVAATYDFTQKNRLTRLEVSILKEELPHLVDRYPGFKYMTQTIPADKSDSYGSAGLITYAMYAVAGFSDKTLHFQNNEDGLSVSVNGMDNDFNRDISKVARNMGYYNSVKEGIITVGFINESTSKKNTNPWEISVPEFLQKV
jgi:hypothetical protein